MCLSAVTTAPSGTPPEHGYKVFRQIDFDREIRPLWQGDGRSLPTDQWLNEKDYAEIPIERRDYIQANDGTLYPRGWHVFLKKIDAIEFAEQLAPRKIVRKVQMKDICAFGYEYENDPSAAPAIKRPVAVCLQIYIER